MIRRPTDEQPTPGVRCPVCNCERTALAHKGELAVGDPVSFSYSFSPDHNKTLPVYSCADCRHHFCSPVPADISSAYESTVDQEYLNHEASRKAAASKLVQVIKRSKSSGLLLDVGCATGDFIEVAAEHGYQCEGLELSAWSAAICAQRGFPVHRNRLEDFAATHAGRYDVVTLWGVIEHFADPSRELGYIEKILKPGGVLALWTGDVSSFTSRVLGRRWWYWQSQHIQYFSKASLTRLLKKHDLSVEVDSIYPFATTSETMNNSLKRYRSHDLLMAVLRPFFKVRPTWFLHVPGEMLVIARKAGHRP